MQSRAVEKEDRHGREGGEGRRGEMGKGEEENVMINVGPTAGMVHTR